ncbi:hypothetical protein ACEZCY_15005 [Streptacidiphilus sp. N1-12]|uniref:DUF5326 family protein n=2 Tax=Streptacidiphilus alkalitolerans TaxID=3342712 RepID=A0ABV6WES4_9ACTN
MNDIWKTLPGWVRNIVVPVVVVIIALWLIFAVLGAVFAVVGVLFGWAFRLLLLLALGAAVVILVKKASR